MDDLCPIDSLTPQEADFFPSVLSSKRLIRQAASLLNGHLHRPAEMVNA